MRLSLHARFEIVIAALLLLGSCGDSAYHRFTEGDYNHLQEAYDVADQANADAGDALDKCNDLETRVSDIETKLNM